MNTERDQYFCPDDGTEDQFLAEMAEFFRCPEAFHEWLDRLDEEKRLRDG